MNTIFSVYMMSLQSKTCTVHVLLKNYSISTHQYLNCSSVVFYNLDNNYVSLVYVYVLTCIA